MARRMKRLAGPAFYINLKYDQQQMRTQKESDVGGNTALDLNNNSGRAYENFDIKEGEIVVTKKTNRKGKHTTVISSLNGGDSIATVGNSDADHKRKLIAEYNFIGIAQTEHVAKKKFEVDQGLVACVGGVVTVQNDHDSTVHPGDRLVLDIPTKHRNIRGIPSTKRRFCLKPVAPSNLSDDMSEALKNQDGLALLVEWLVVVRAQPGNTDASNTAFRALFTRHIKPIIDNHTNFVAKALSHAKKGERLDILLHPRHVS
tara:strand:+ start:7385 stop:8161 length:777 start_codon:yes stop_codon:yes gene_type:complete